MKSYIGYAAFLKEIKKQTTHYHDSHQIIFVKSGKIDITINDKTKTARGGDFVIISRFENHSIKIFTPQYERYILRINNIPYEDRIFSLFTNRPENFTNIISTANAKENFISLLDRIIFEHSKNDKFSVRYQNLLINELMIDICRLLPEEIYDFNDTDFNYVFNLQQEFENNYSFNFSLTQLADKYNISVSTLSHNFKKIAGLSVFEYLLSCRMAAAKTFLAKTNFTISEIVEKCGFADNSNFSRTFKRINGITPTAFRNTFKTSK